MTARDFDLFSCRPNEYSVIALYSPRESLKPDCVSRLRRKKPKSLPSECNGTLSLVRFEEEGRGFAAMLSDSQRNVAGFLCNSDCMAEVGVPMFRIGTVRQNVSANRFLNSFRLDM